MRIVVASLVAALAALLTTGAAAQDYPTKTVELVVPQGTGAAQDLLARVLAPEMAKLLNRPVIVANKPGADLVLGYEYLFNAPADGHRIILLNMSNQASMPVTVKDLRFDPVTSITPVIGIAEQRLYMISGVAKPWKNFGEMADYARKNPRKLNFGAPAALPRILSEGVFSEMKLEVAIIPYSSTEPWMAALLSGEADMGMVAPAILKGNIDNFRPLAVSGLTRAREYPDVPTYEELKLGKFGVGSGFSLNVPDGTPKSVVDRLYSVVSQVLKQNDVSTRIAALGLEVTNAAPEQVRKSVTDTAAVLMDISKRSTSK